MNATILEVKKSKGAGPATALNHAEFARRLGEWFALNARDLPWREPQNMRDPYRVLVSEVMLQQTTVVTVAPRYRRFLERFPTLPVLAAAPLDDVLAEWSGLGYYQRARNLHACAAQVMALHHGVFPKDLAGILALPGVGRYTAGAVASIAQDVAAPIVDANVARVLARVLCLEGDLKASANQQRLWEEAARLVVAAAATGDLQCRPGSFNPAMMELGALVCLPTPLCTACPVEKLCYARATGRENELPHATPKTAFVNMHDACAFVSRTSPNGTQVLVRQRPHEAKVWWRGMWELPRVTVAGRAAGAEALQQLLSEELGVPAAQGDLLKTLKHGVTHHKITLDCWEMKLGAAGNQAPCDSDLAWRTWEELQQLAMPSVMHRLLTWLRQRECAPQLPLV